VISLRGLLVEDLKEILFSSPRIAIIFHWDSDGIASASMLKEVLESNGAEVLSIVPTIGYYNVDAIPLSKIKEFNPDLIIVADYALKPWDLEQLEYEITTPVMVVDHHLNRLPEKPLYHNPVARGLPGELYPSTTWVLRELLGLDVNLRVLLGIAGDCGVKAEDTPLWDTIRYVLESHGWNWDKIIGLVELVDSNYRLGDYEGILRAVDKLISYGDNLDNALEDKEWVRKKKVVDEEVNRIMESGPDKILGNILVYRVESKYYIASTITRRFTLKHQDKVVVVAFKHLGEGPCHVYIRSWRYDLSPILSLLLLRKYEVGGKKEVVALTVDCKILEQALQDVLEVIEEVLEV